jgi:hypothetical protein
VGPTTRRFGRDRVEIYGDRLTIITPAGDMPGWEVRRYRAPVVRFEGRTWRITARTRGRDKTTRYDLEAWEPHHGDVPGPEIEYSAASVELRDHADDLGRKRSRVTGVLGFITPLTGFLPAKTKDRLEAVYGIDPVASTHASVMIEAIVALGAFVLATIAQFVKIYGYSSGISATWMVVIGAVVAIDAGIRWSRLMADERPAPGFYEWVFRRRP